MSDEKVTMSQDKTKEVLENVVSGLMGKINDKMDQIQKDIDQKIQEVTKNKVSPPHITGGNELLEDDPKGGFKGFWHFMRDVAIADKSHGRQISKTLANWDRINKAAGTGLSTGDDQYGGYLVPAEFRREIIDHIMENNDLIQRCTLVPMSTNILEIPVLDGYDQSSGYVSGGVVAYWVDEQSEITASRPKIAKLQLKLHKVSCLAYASDEILSDSPVSMQFILQKGFSNAISFQYNKVIIRGTGAGQPQGLLVSPAKVVVSPESAQPAGTIEFENIVKMYQSIYDPSNAIWLANPNTMIQLATMSLTVGTGGVPVWMPAGGVSGKPYNTLFGLPLFFNDHCSTLGTEGDIILVNLSEYYIGRKAVANESDLRYDESIHVKFEYDQMAFRVITRLAGQCSWPAYFTPPQATTSYRSPIVTLATRS